MKTLLHTTITASAFALLTACGSNAVKYDATGTFEATEVTVSAEQNGRLISLDLIEGDKVEAGVQVGLIDTVQLYLKARQVGATKLVYAAQRPDLQKQISVTKQQLAQARKEVERFTTLVNEGAANSKMLDDVENQVEVLENQLSAQTSALNNTVQSLDAQMSTADIQMLQIADQLKKCYISSPVDGTILEKYAQAGEFTVAGKPLFKVADLSTMYMRAYVTSAQLSQVQIGQKVKAYAAYGAGDRNEYEGIVTWISSRSEFTPKTILTDDERADLVYAIKIKVANDGNVKIGMYGEVKFQ